MVAVLDTKGARSFMMILVSHDNHIKGSAELTTEVSDLIDRGNSVSQVIRGATNKWEDLIESTLEKLSRRQSPVHPPMFEAVEETAEELDAEEAEVQV